MPNWAELSSLATALDEITRRVSDMGDEAAKAKDEGAATDLYEIERTLRAAARRLNKLVS
jgi:hypothetical protein